MPLFEAVRLALSQIRAQKLKSFFTLLGVTIGTMFLIAVVSVVNGMGRYVEQDFAAKFLGVLTFNLRRFPDIQTGDVTEATWRAWMQRPRITEQDAYAVEISKTVQLAILRKLGLRHPPTRVINNPALSVDAAAGLRYPVLIKPNVGGSGAGIRFCRSGCGRLPGTWALAAAMTRTAIPAPSTVAPRRVVGRMKSNSSPG